MHSNLSHTSQKSLYLPPIPRLQNQFTFEETQIPQQVLPQENKEMDISLNLTLKPKIVNLRDMNAMN